MTVASKIGVDNDNDECIAIPRGFPNREKFSLLLVEQNSVFRFLPSPFAAVCELPWERANSSEHNSIAIQAVKVAS